MTNTDTVLAVSSLTKRFNLEAGFFAKQGSFVYAVNDVSFRIGKGETYGLVGESGCGKSTTARLLVRMYKPDSGSILYTPNAGNGTDNAAVDAVNLKGAALKKYREQIKYVFQDPAKSLNPRMSVYEILTSGYRWSSYKPDKIRARAEAAAILEETGLDAADLDRNPAEFSGGQRQRISIARALLMKPRLLICDEVVSALDVSIQGQILNLLQDIRKKRDLSLLFIAHDLKVSCYFCDRIGVMYKGMIMEEAPAADLYRTALHPYTKMLFAGAGFTNTPETGQQHKPGTQTAQPAAHNPPGANTPDGTPGSTHRTPGTPGYTGGCPFADRCPEAAGRCLTDMPELKTIPGTTGTPGAVHKVRCHNAPGT